MVFVIPADPFPEALGAGIASATQSVAEGYTKRKQQQYMQNLQRQQNYNLAKTLGVPEEQAQEFAGLNPAQVPQAAKVASSRAQAPAYADFLIQALGVEPDSQVAQSLKQSTDVESLIEMGKFLATQQKAAPKQLSPRGQAALQKVQRGEELTMEDTTGLNTDELKIILRGQETSTLGGGDIQKEFLKVNLDYGKDLKKKGEEAKRLGKELDIMADLVTSGATDNKITNYLGKSEALRWMLSPGSQAFLTGLKDQFADFKETFGARPTQYEAQIFEQGLPSLMASREGKLAAVYMNKAKRDAAIAKRKAYDKINKETGYKPVSGDFIERVEEVADIEVNKIYEDLRDKLFGLMERQHVTKTGNVIFKNEITGETIEAPARLASQYKQYGWEPLK